MSAVQSSQRFEESQHHMLNSELKKLYVALTRARENLWIFESTPQTFPMLQFWEAARLVRTLRASQLEEWRAMATRSSSSSNETWIKRGTQHTKERRTHTRTHHANTHI